jgi:hemolysin activation/secretion protein
MMRPNVKILLAVLFVAVCNIAVAQNYERYKPLDPNLTAPTIPEIDREQLDPVAGDGRVLIDRTDAIILIDSADKVSLDPSIDSLEGIHVDVDSQESLVHQGGVQAIASGYIGKPITLRNVNQLARDIILHYRKCKLPIVDVRVPEQRITGGTLQLVIIETRIDQVRVREGCYFKCASIEKWIQCTRTGNRVYEPNLESDLLWLNSNPFRAVSVDFEKGRKSGTTDVIYTVNDVRPLRGYVGMDDTGVKTLRYGRAFAGFSYGNLFGRGGILGYQYTTDQDFAFLRAHALSYSMPLNRRYSLTGAGSWAAVSPVIGGGLAQQGESWQLTGGLTRHLSRTQYGAKNLSLNVDFKSTNNNLEFAGSTVSNSDADLLQLRLGYDEFRRRSLDSYGVLSWSTVVGPGGGMTGAHSAAAFQTIRPGTSPDYIYSRLNLDRMEPLGGGWLGRARFAGQVSSERLLFSEMLGLGGFDTIRGFDQRSFNADHGWLASFEFGPCTKRWGCEDLRRSFRPYMFTDLGNGYLESPQAGEDSYAFGLSTGVGFRYNIGDSLTARFDYGYGLIDLGNTQRDNRAHFGLTWIPGPRPTRR